MSKPKVYVDGQAGTTGLQILSRLENRDDIELLKIDEALRHDDAARKEMMAKADLVFLCLPDAAAIDAVKLAENLDCKIIDASTAHRTKWTYGFAELDAAHEQAIAQAKRVANPGCHASGFIALVYPLIQSGLLPASTLLTCFSLTGYSGGGKNMIGQYEDENRDSLLDAPHIYGLNMAHKHLPEMVYICGLETSPLFSPIVADFDQGMAVSLQIPASAFTKNVDPDSLRAFYTDWYAGQPLMEVEPAERSGMLSALEMRGKDSMKLCVNGSGDVLLLTALFDNLGKGASGAAVENMNLMLGFEKEKGLVY